jgi:hypothetical protein
MGAKSIVVKNYVNDSAHTALRGITSPTAARLDPAIRSTIDAILKNFVLSMKKNH